MPPPVASFMVAFQNPAKAQLVVLPTSVSIAASETMQGWLGQRGKGGWVSVPFTRDRERLGYGPCHACCTGRLTARGAPQRSEEHTSELQSQSNLVCRLLLEKKKTYRMQPQGFPGRSFLLCSPSYFIPGCPATSLT